MKVFSNTFKFSNNDINKFILLLRKGVYPYECMDEWKKFNETEKHFQQFKYGRYYKCRLHASKKTL